MFRFSRTLAALSIVAVLFGAVAQSRADVLVQSSLPAGATMLWDFSGATPGYQESYEWLVQTFKVDTAMTLDKLHIEIINDSNTALDSDTVSLELWQVDTRTLGSRPQVAAGDTLLESWSGIVTPGFTGDHQERVLTWDLSSNPLLAVSSGNEGYAVQLVTSGSGNNFAFGCTNSNANPYTSGDGQRYVSAPIANTDFTVALSPAVPEPSVLILLATGLFGLLAYAWRKRK